MSDTVSDTVSDTGSFPREQRLEPCARQQVGHRRAGPARQDHLAVEVAAVDLHDQLAAATAGREHAVGVDRDDAQDLGLARALEKEGFEGIELKWPNDLVFRHHKLGGILILFDEFTLYMERYGHRTAPAELQDLLNGVDTLRGQAAFLAFAQQDPDTTADNLHSLNPSSRASLKKVLTRLERKLQLSTLLESVIDAYLSQRKAAWDQFAQLPETKGRIFNASDVAFERFSRRYRDTLRWSTQTFQETVTRGCFPLHPITTYLLCNMTLGTISDAGSARTMLGFVREYLQEKQEQSAVSDGRPNWVLPVDLLDYFKDRFSGSTEYTAYQTAATAAGPEATPAQQALLKALLLQQLAGVMTRLGEDQRAFLAQSAGLSEDEAKRELRALSERNVILWNPDRKTYSLFPVSANPQILEKKIGEKIEQLGFDTAALEALNTMLREKVPNLVFGSKPIQVDWGHACLLYTSPSPRD